MSADLVVYGFDTSNNFKVRVALGYKGIRYTFERIEPTDREKVLEVSGQPLTPVIVHGDAVLFDSSAILRYLDANFPDTPRLFPPDRMAIYEIESWESFARRELQEAIRVPVFQRIQGRTDEAELAEAAEAFAEATARLEEELAGREWLVGDEMTAADVAVAPAVFRGAALEGFPTLDDRPRTLGWVDRVMAYDQPPA